jgi:hypothetical protein
VTSCAVLIPVLDRPHRAAPVAESVRASDERVTPIFLCSPYDDAEIAAVQAAGETPLIVKWPPGRGDYARKMNHGYWLARQEHEWVFLGADDLTFHAGWLNSCLRWHDRTGACVIGTNDLGNARVIARRHSTHTLVHRDYLECGTIDETDRILHEGYWHNYVDDEFVQTAMVRGTYTHAPDALVEHLHPNWGKAVQDATYQLGLAHFTEDRLLYERRCDLWAPYPLTQRHRR